ncbi:MAG: amino acid adenylation domain-containing protein [Pseudonocardia sp.]|nr:amino acid adenylation domain-containing protein [Pseudonocardia sp.]
MQSSPGIDLTEMPTRLIPQAVYEVASPPPPRTLIDIFTATARAYPDAPALDDGDEVLSYRECQRRVSALRDELLGAGIAVGDRIGVRMPSGCNETYLAILAVLASAAAYVPVDLDDPEERVEMVWREAQVRGVLETGGRLRLTQAALRRDNRGLTAKAPIPTPMPKPSDDAWIIFTSGSTGRPKGVAITHRSAAAFVDAEAQLFVQDRPLGPGDRVLAGLSVAFDASCEEMWLAWRHGACLAPAARSLVRAGVEFGSWLVERKVTVVSTVPTLAALWPQDALDRVRLLILGGEACPAELAKRLSRPGREVWNTYGPTETTVVACGARLDQGGPVRIGLPLAGWSLAVLDSRGLPVHPGDVGELVIAGVGTGRYLDPVKDAEKFRPVPMLGWDRAYRSGDLVRADPEGLVFIGRADDQVKLGGRRIELGEIDAALLALPEVTSAAAAVRTTAGGGDVLVGYLVPDTPPGKTFDTRAARAALAESLPRGLVPQLVVMDALPVRTSGKVDRAAMPWPVAESADAAAQQGTPASAARAAGTVGWLAGVWQDLLGVPVDRDADFFDLGGTSLATAKLVAKLRERYPEASVADIYQNSRLTKLARRLDELGGDQSGRRPVHPTPASTGPVQALVLVGLYLARGLQWMLGLAVLTDLAAVAAGQPLLGPPIPWVYLAAGWLLLISPPGRLLIVVGLGARWICRGVRPGCYPRGGSVHLRLWTAQRLVTAFGMRSLAGTALAAWYARLLGCQVGAHVDLRTDPPVTGLARLDDGCAIEAGADLSGWWLDGDMVHVGEVRVGAHARVGARSTLMPGAVVGERAEIEAGACVLGEVPVDQRWSGVPARHVGAVGEGWPAPRQRRFSGWTVLYTVSMILVSVLPTVASLPGLALFELDLARDHKLEPRDVLVIPPIAGMLAALCYALIVGGLVRLAGLGLRPGFHPVDSRAGWGAWLVERLLQSSRMVLFPIYSSLATPVWFRMLGARVGTRAEISTTTGLPTLMRVQDGGFLADDTLVAPYELRGGWVRIGRSGVGRRAFAGNSSIIGPDRALGDDSLIAVLSSAPDEVAANSSWIGRPALELPRVPDVIDASRTFNPPARLVVARAAVELLRVLPWAMSSTLGAIVFSVLALIRLKIGWVAAAVASGFVLLAAGVVALSITTLAKWVLVGRFKVGEHPLWSSFVWRNELFDVFYEEMAMPWLGTSLLGTPMLNVWLRTLGARIGRGVWCESHWLPETDLVRLDDGATVNRGCVLQTHLFHDRLMRIDHVHLGAGATLGPHSILLPGAVIGTGAGIGGLSLVMRGEHVPPNSRWLGNPIAAWPEEFAFPDQPTGRGRHSAVVMWQNQEPTNRGGFALAAAVAALAAGGLAGPFLLANSSSQSPAQNTQQAPLSRPLAAQPPGPAATAAPTAPQPKSLQPPAVVHRTPPSPPKVADSGKPTAARSINTSKTRGGSARPSR